jgi:hemerythrin superfamily protein
MDAFQMLKEDHRKVEDLFAKIDETTERAEKTREELFGRAKRELDVHAHLEETLVYPELRKAEETRELTLEAFEEHKVVKELLAELDRMAKGTEQWKAKFTVLKENVEHHVKEEEDELFKDGKEVLDSVRRDVLGKAMAEEKARFLERLEARSRKTA